jgi:hypothetical protein
MRAHKGPRVHLLPPPAIGRCPQVFTGQQSTLHAKRLSCLLVGLSHPQRAWYWVVALSLTGLPPLPDRRLQLLLFQSWASGQSWCLYQT